MDILSAKLRSLTARRPVFWTVVGLLLISAAEFWIFDQIGAKRYNWIPPRWNDQVQYLGEAYRAHESVKTVGMRGALWASLTNVSAQGTLYEFWTTLLFHFTGASRSAALALNFGWFLLWQALAFWSVRMLTRRPWLPWLVMGLWPCVYTLAADEPGSVFDFRLDWMTACTFGISLAAAFKTENFQRRGWSCWFGVTVALTLLTRFLTGTYYLGIYGVMLGVCLLSRERLRRLGNMALSMLVTLVLAGPVYWLNREHIYNYYFIGHFTGPESALRSAHVGVIKSFQWVFETLSTHHLGPLLSGLLLSGLLAGPIFLFESRGRIMSALRARASFLVPALAFGVVPLVILSLHQQKSMVVLSIMLPSALTLAVLVLGFWLRYLPNKVAGMLAALVVVMGLTIFTRAMRREPTGIDIAGYRDLVRLSNYVYEDSRHHPAPRTWIAVDRITNSFDAEIMRLVVYERHHVWPDFAMTLPTGIMELDPALVVRALEISDYVFLTADGPTGAWPFDQQLRRLLPVTKAWCDSHLVLAEKFGFNGNTILFYRKPPVVTTPPKG